MTPNPTDANPRTDARLVSVVVLNYNYGRYLTQCIDSVLAQDYPVMEVIVVDDGSTDESRAVVESYGSRIVASFKPNGGMVSSMNHGFRLSRGEVVIFVDADDFLLPGAVAEHERALRERGVVRSQTYMVVLNGTRPSDARIPDVPAAEGDLRALILRNGPGAYVSSPNSGNAWSRGFLEQVLPLPETLKAIGAEPYLMDAAPLFGRIVTLKPEPLAAYRLHDANMQGALVSMTAVNIHKTIAKHRARAARLEQVARSQGYEARAADWQSRNWRLLTLDYLSDRIAGQATCVPLVRHLRPAFTAQGHPAKRPLLALALLCVRIAPLKASLYLAGRLIKLRYM